MLPREGETGMQRKKEKGKETKIKIERQKQEERLKDKNGIEI